MMKDNNTCYLCGHELAKHRIIKFTPTHLSISCGDITDNIVSDCGCNGGFTTTVSIKLEETK